ncbi:transposase, partial [Bacillus cereus]|nr:transposase [Bacillus cereus]MDR4293250.1 transposase [Bacillus cereus]
MIGLPQTIKREVFSMTPRRYELTNEQWEQIKDFFPPYSTGRPPKRSNREMFNAI